MSSCVSTLYLYPATDFTGKDLVGDISSVPLCIVAAVYLSTSVLQLICLSAHLFSPAIISAHFSSS